MSPCKASGLAIFAAVCLLGETAGSAHAQCYYTPFPVVACDTATEWSGGSVANLGGLPGYTYSEAVSINNVGQAVGLTEFSPGYYHATEWSGGSVINLGGLSGSFESVAYGINNAGQVVGKSYVGGVVYATEWSGGSVINLGPLPGSTASGANSINNAGQVVGGSGVGGVNYATEWSDNVINLEGPPGFCCRSATFTSSSPCRRPRPRSPFRTSGSSMDC
jgi:probable HAF family extracellular repeat protein